jgi:hypothetical protein
MPWHILIILLIPVAVVILSSLFRTAEQKNRRDRPGGEFRPPPRRPVTDLDRFLDEARRRREPPERREVPGGSEVTPATKPGPPPRPPRQTPPRPREIRLPPRRQPVLLEDVPPSRPPAAPPPPVQVPVAEPVRSASAAPAVRAPAPAITPMTPTPSRQQALSPVLQQVAQVLRTPRSAATAVVLREVFGPPLCMRRR